MAHGGPEKGTFFGHQGIYCTPRGKRVGSGLGTGRRRMFTDLDTQRTAIRSKAVKPSLEALKGSLTALADAARAMVSGAGRTRACKSGKRFSICGRRNRQLALPGLRRAPER